MRQPGRRRFYFCLFFRVDRDKGESDKTPQPFWVFGKSRNAKRKWAYGPQSITCTFSDALMVEANQRGWNVISLKNGWKKIFAFKKKQESAMNANGAFKVSVAAIDKETTMNIHSDGLAAALSGFSPARVVICALLSLGMLAPALAEMSAEELAKLAQNPVGNLISVPFQNNTNLNFGPEKKTQNILNIQPVIPISVNDDWNIITRTIVPVISMPGLYPGDDRTNGIGDTVLTAFVSPAKPGSWIWGVGPVAQIPTNTDNELGNKNWGLGPSVVVLHLEKGSPWVYGALVNNIWSLSGDKQGGSYNNGMIQPFVNYNFPGGLYVVSAPIITANWKAEDSQRWTVPVGGGVGKIFHLGKLPVNAQLSAYYNVVTPDDGANWQIRAQVQFMFPK